MERHKDFELQQMLLKLHTIEAETLTLAEEAREDSLALLALLRTLEGLHRKICEELFQESLPDNRQALYALLKDIEASGGWPYIHRMRLQSFLSNLLDPSSLDNHAPSKREAEEA